METSVSTADEYQLGPFKIKVKENILASEQGDVVLLPKVMALLVYLCRHSQQVVTFDELNTAIWPKEVVGDNAIYNLVGQLRKALGDSASNPTYVQTVSKVGYRLLLKAKPMSSIDIEAANTEQAISVTVNEAIGQSVVSKTPRAILLIAPLVLLFGAVLTVMIKKQPVVPSTEAERQMQLVHYQLYRGDNEGIDQAIDTLQQLIAVEPSWDTAKIELGYSFIRKARSNPDEKNFWLDKAEAIASDQALGRKGLRLAGIIKAKRQPSSSLHELFAKDDILVSARLAYCDVLFAQGKTADALKQAQLALAQCADCPYVYRKVAMTQMVFGDVQEGFDNFSRYRMLINRTSNNPADNAGYVPLNKQSLAEMANWHFHSPKSKTLLNHQSNALALFYLSLGKTELAATTVMSTPESSDQFYDLYTHAAISGARGDFQSSYQLLAKRQSVYPDNDRFKLSVVYALWQLGHAEQALDALKQFKLMPDTQSLPENLPFGTWSVYAALLLESGQRKQGEEILTRLEQQLTTGFTPGSQVADIRLASVYALQGKKEAAVAQLRVAISQGWVSDFNQNWWYLEDSPYFRDLADSQAFRKAIADYHKGIAEVYALAIQSRS